MRLIVLFAVVAVAGCGLSPVEELDSPSGTETSDITPAVSCKRNGDCASGEFCDFKLQSCDTQAPASSMSHVAVPGTCRPLPCNGKCEGSACTKNEDCAPSEFCDGAKCRFAGSCTAIVECGEGCEPYQAPHTYCPVCLCEKC